MHHDAILHLLGLARKAGRLELGEEPVGALCRARHARLILLACNAAPNTCRRAAHFGDAGNVLWLTLPYSKEELGFLFGRGSCAMLALSDAGLSARLVEKLAVANPERYGPAALQLREKADRMLQRQREKRQHEKNLRTGKHKPFAPPPPHSLDAPPPPPKHRHASFQPKPTRPNPPASAPRREPGHGHSHGPGRPFKPGPGGRKLSGKFRNIP